MKKEILISNCKLEQIKNKAEIWEFDFGGVLYQRKKGKNAERYCFEPKKCLSLFRNSFAPAFTLKFDKAGKDVLLEVSFYIPLIQKIMLCLMISVALMMQIMIFVSQGRIFFRMTEELVCYLPSILALILFFAQSIFGFADRRSLNKKIKLFFQKTRS